jgi:hypothetical protein
MGAFFETLWCCRGGAWSGEGIKGFAYLGHA